MALIDIMKSKAEHNYCVVLYIYLVVSLTDSETCTPNNTRLLLSFVLAFRDPVAWIENESMQESRPVKKRHEKSASV